ncbi:MAG: DUF3800 domain-containing protein, partial [Candidatus Pacearchaeota archaeon]
KKIRQRKLEKKIKKLVELKANNSNKKIREYILKKVKNSDCNIFAVVVNKSKILSQLYEVKDKLYNYLCGILMDRIILPRYKIMIIIDKKHTNTLIREDFNNYIQKKIKNKDPGLKIEIFHKPSYMSNELQVTDFVAWAINRKFSFGDNYYYSIIKNKIINKENMLLWK